MNRRITDKALLLCAALVFSFFICKAQFLHAEDSTIYNSAVRNTIQYFYESSRNLSRYYNGKEYVGTSYKFSEGSPFFLSDEATPGSVVYDHVLYSNVRLLYDEFLDELIFIDESHRISLIPEKVTRFSILNNHFVRIDTKDKQKLTVSPGYYQVLYDGQITVLRKDQKKLRELPAFSGEQKTFVLDTKPIYFLKKENDYFEIHSKKDFLNLIKDHTKEIQDFIKKNGIKFKKDLGDDLRKVAGYYEQLSVPE